MTGNVPFVSKIVADIFHPYAGLFAPYEVMIPIK